MNFNKSGSDSDLIANISALIFAYTIRNVVIEVARVHTTYTLSSGIKFREG